MGLLVFLALLLIILAWNVFKTGATAVEEPTTNPASTGAER